MYQEKKRSNKGTPCPGCVSTRHTGPRRTKRTMFRAQSQDNLVGVRGYGNAGPIGVAAMCTLSPLSGHSSSLWRPTHVLEMQGCTVSFHMHMSAVLVVEFLQRTLAGEAEPAGGHTHTHEVPGLSSRGGGGQGGRGEVGGGLDCPLRRWVRREAGKVIGSASTDSNTLADWVSAITEGTETAFHSCRSAGLHSVHSRQPSRPELTP